MHQLYQKFALSSRNIILRRVEIHSSRFTAKLSTQIYHESNTDTECRNSFYVHSKEKWPTDILSQISTEMRLIPNFVNEEEEKSFLNETSVALKRLRYEKDHWDNV